MPSPVAILALPAPPGPAAPLADRAAAQAYLSSLGSYKRYTAGTIAHFYARWWAYFQRHRDADFHWYRGRYVNIIANGHRGREFERLMNAALGLDEAGGWRLNRKITGVRGLERNRRPDAFHPTNRYIFEYKAKTELSQEDLGQLRDYVRIAEQFGKQVVYFFEAQPSAATLRAIEEANASATRNRNRPAGTPLAEIVAARVLPAVADPVQIPENPRAPPLPAVMRPATSPGAPPATSPGAPTTTSPGSAAGQPRPGGDPVVGGGGSPAPGVLASAGQYAADGGLSHAVARSPDSAADTAAQAALEAEFADEFDEDHVRGAEPLGGVDFSTLELRYVSDAYLGEGARFAFRADAAPEAEPSYGGRRAAQLASDSFFVWLSLPVSAFTVNLHPDEPDRIIDEAFGRTDAGRVLLEADLLMKKTTAELIHPNTPGGRALWEAMVGDGSCLTLRQWIVPAPARVRESESELFILDAPLEVKMETEYLQRRGADGALAACAADPRATERNEALYNDLILPRVEQAVNTAPEYADLRRVYYSRVAAQWYRDRAATRPHPYAHLMDSGDISRWTSRRPWSPREVFDRYVKSFTDGEFKVEERSTRGNVVLTSTYVFGGVDFSSVPREVENAARRPDRLFLPQALERSLHGSTGERESREVWLGGMTATRPIDELLAGPPQPMSGVLFYVLAGAPVLAWLAAGAWLLRKRRHAGAESATGEAGP